MRHDEEQEKEGKRNTEGNETKKEIKKKIEKKFENANQKIFLTLHTFEGGLFFGIIPFRFMINAIYPKRYQHLMPYHFCCLLICWCTSFQSKFALIFRDASNYTHHEHLSD